MSTSTRNRRLPICLAVCTLLGLSSVSFADVVLYELQEVRLDSGGALISGEFTWTYDPGDFENGEGEFVYLEIPYTTHDHTDLLTTIDVTGSIEIVLDGSVHDDGVDITMFLIEPLTPTTGSDLDLTRRKFGCSHAAPGPVFRPRIRKTRSPGTGARLGR